MRFVLAYCKEKRGAFLFALLCIGLFAGAFALYHLPLKAVLYPTALCVILALGCVAADFHRMRKKHRTLQALQALPENLCETLRAYEAIDDVDYQAILKLLSQREAQLQEAAQMKFFDMIDYYTTWVHQIKTPIASIRLTLQNEDSPLSRRVDEDLFRIEQYVQMVLTYLRLDSKDTDYVFREYPIDTIVKTSLRKFAKQFICKGIRLAYTQTEKTVVTDEKWLCFVLEQVLSNALKYASSGTIFVYMEEPATLCVRDEGVGIAPEDLPRIFEQGYTGYNGRTDKRASGLGLYLCHRICKNLGHSIGAESVLGVGTTIKIGLEQRKTRFE